MSESYSDSAPAAVPSPYDALDAFLTEHRHCRPGLDDPQIPETVVALWCTCGARIAVDWPARWPA